MTERRKFKKELSKLKSYRKTFPRLMDCSEVFTDNYFNETMLKRLDNDISKIEKKIAKIDLSQKQ